MCKPCFIFSLSSNILFFLKPNTFCSFRLRSR
ncbi:hypothetical protein MPF_1061 [Methanohalophilus portucalensis FDF-1]|uniref:Uncharacterized protein n=1 Tax=Methanohalophilus portucalensis FDF-1 TaxID=523843 RepID=A0A1L9C3S1_9EURY|nr:hypothetical protein MPF_1061 [Methanohalophilus portucalensis FDF-1]